MARFEHKKIQERIAKLDTVPDSDEEFNDWIRADNHLEFLSKNAEEKDVVIYASDEYSFVHAVIVPNENLEPIDSADLLQWSLDPYNSIANYVSGGGREGVWIERGLFHVGARTLDNATQLIFGRTFEGWNGKGANYYELNQEYSHLNGIHWRPEHSGYCRFDSNGDLEPLVSVTSREDKNSESALVTFIWGPLEEYLSASNSSLVRMFDFTLLRRGNFHGWPNSEPEQHEYSPNIIYRQVVIPGHAAYTRGVQIIRPRRSDKAVQTGITDAWFGASEREHAEFIAHDWRNGCVTKISTDPRDTTNYFEAGENSLPFELSPAFFKPEVLLKYKSDRDKYTVEDRAVSCRSAWRLRGIDRNEAGQLHAYICDLRTLPYSEQLHWLSFNEEPKSGVSKRAIKNDFEGQFYDDLQPLQVMLSILRKWDSESCTWWKLREQGLVEKVSVPVTASRDEWAEAFMDVAKLVVEGFCTKPIRQKLDEVGVSYEKDDRTIALLEKLLSSSGIEKLDGLRSVQFLRSKAKGHVGGSEAHELSTQALSEHGSYAEHFQSICSIVSAELKVIEDAFS